MQQNGAKCGTNRAIWDTLGTVWCGTVGRFVVARSHKLPRLLALIAGFLLVLGVPARLPAQSPGVGDLQNKQAALAAQSRAAVVELYGLESRLGQARTDLANADARAAALRRTQASVRARFESARRTTSSAQRQLANQLRYLYEQGEPDPIAVVLGATSLEEALFGLDAVDRAAKATQGVVDQARAARRDLVKVRRELAIQVLRSNQARARLAAVASGLEQAQTEKTSYLASLRREQDLTAAQISRLEAQAQAAQQKAQEVSQQTTTQQPSTTASAPAAPTSDAGPSEPPPSPVESVATDTTPTPTTAAPPPPRPGGTMTVYATGYCLTGTTATGLPVGPGIVATDPSVIPLGTRMTIPGYGEGVAADTGGAIKGARIDVWIKDCGAASAFTRSVTITFH